MEYSYQLNCGQYVLHRDGAPVGPLLDEVAIALDKESGTRHKHGCPEAVRNWVVDAQAKFRAGGFDTVADALVVIQGRFTVEDLNKVIDNSSYAKVLYDQIQAGQAKALGIDGVVVLPELAQ